ncbi:hypothetical protein VNO77_44754 [Canavalia gladiata]|uniref:Uncharacterized protein n=1 Tax=Canavalia gladiata TaxID=3824 RepID=A0AAN9JZ07_CANGL
MASQINELHLTRYGSDILLRGCGLHATKLTWGSNTVGEMLLTCICLETFLFESMGPSPLLLAMVVFMSILFLGNHQSHSSPPSYPFSSFERFFQEPPLLDRGALFLKKTLNLRASGEEKLDSKHSLPFLMGVPLSLSILRRLA